MLFLLFTVPLENGIITSASVEQAMKKVDRAEYCPFTPYYDSPQTIGYQATISAPHMVHKIINTLWICLY